MSGYNYAPPPPPPAASGQQPYSGPSYGQGRGGGPSGRGRGGYYSGGHQASAPMNQDYASQPYPHHHHPHHPPPPQASYGNPYPPAGSYAPAQPQWPHPQSARAPAPMPAANYHPNYSQQPYAQPQYPQQPPYQPAPAYHQSYAGQPPPNPPQQWSGQGHSQPPYGNESSRGGYNNRGGGAIKRDPDHPPHTYGNAPVYPHDPRGGQYPPAPYHYAPPPPPPSNARGHHDEYQGHNRSRGSGFRGRGRGGGNFGDRNRQSGGNKGPNNRGNHANHAHGQKPTKQENDAGGKAGKKKKRKTNTLGLTPGNEGEDENESASEDDDGEEKALLSLLGHEAFQVDDIAAFIAERKKNYPTKARVEAKKTAELAQKSEDKASLLEKQADRLRRQLRKVESSIKRKREQGDEGDDMRSSSVDSDDGPEEVSTKSGGVKLEDVSPDKRADVKRHCKYFSTGGTCGKKSKCRFVHDPEVRKAAIHERERNNGRLTIQQRLILNDKDQEDLAILESIQYLRQKGIMSAPKPEVVVKNESKDSTSTVTKDAPKDASKATLKAAPVVPTTTHSLLPAAPASLPPPPPKREPVSGPRRDPSSIVAGSNHGGAQGVPHYQNWLSEPYGSSNGKSDNLP